jgi:hypothetical protein
MEKGGIQVTRLVDLADYQEGSIVSRTIIDCSRYLFMS